MKNSFLVTALLLTLVIIFAGCTEEMETINQPDDYPDPPVTTWFLDIQGTAADDIWIAGQPGVLMHFDGTSWSLEDHGDVALTSLYNTEGTTYVCGHSGTIMKNSGSGWSDMSSGIDSNLYDIGQGPYGETFACGQGGAVLKLNGSSWENTPDEIFWISQNDTILRSEDDIESFITINKYAIGGSNAVLLVEADPDSTHQYWVKGPIEAVLGEWIVAGWTDEQSIDNNWLVGADGHLYRLLEDAYGELSYVETSSPGGDHINLADLTDIWVDENNSCWFASKDGLVFKRTPAEVIESPDYKLSSEDLTYNVAPGTSLNGIWGTSSTDIWVVGYGGVVYHFDGTDWTQQDVPLPN